MSLPKIFQWLPVELLTKLLLYLSNFCNYDNYEGKESCCIIVVIHLNQMHTINRKGGKVVSVTRSHSVIKKNRLSTLTDCSQHWSLFLAATFSIMSFDQYTQEKQSKDDEHQNSSQGIRDQTSKQYINLNYYFLMFINKHQSYPKKQEKEIIKPIKLYSQNNIHTHPQEQQHCH